jgi:hypothetical protein
MTEHKIREDDQTNSLRKVVSVKVPPERAWRVFTEKMGTWWLLAIRPCMIYKVGKAKAADVVIEPHAGGRWYDRGDNGSTYEWGRVLSWQPHSRIPALLGDQRRLAT